MGRRIGLHPKRLTPDQEARLAHLRDYCAFLERTRNLTDTVHHDELRQLEALELSVPQTEITETKEND
jgi:hypothetical protein